MTAFDTPDHEGIDSLPDGFGADTLFDLLSKARRRYAIQAIDRHGGMDVGDLSELVAAQETAQPVDGVSRQERKRVYVALHQNHLQKLDEAGVVIYDHSKGRVECGPRLGVVAWYLDHGPAQESNVVWRTMQSLLDRAGVGGGRIETTG